MFKRSCRLRPERPRERAGGGAGGRSQVLRRAGPDGRLPRDWGGDSLRVRAVDTLRTGDSTRDTVSVDLLTLAPASGDLVWGDAERRHHASPSARLPCRRVYFHSLPQPSRN